MDIIQVTNPKFRAQTMRSIIVANARHQLQLAGQVRTLDYHRHVVLLANGYLPRTGDRTLDYHRHVVLLANGYLPRTGERTLDYHRHAFLAKSDRERKALASQLAEMTTIMEVEWIRPPAATFPAAPSWRRAG